MRKGFSSLLCEPLMIDDRYRSIVIDLALKEIRQQQTMSDVLPDPVVEVQMFEAGTGDKMMGEDLSGYDEGSVIAVVPLAGVITRHGYSGWFNSSPGSLELGRHLTRLNNDPAVAAIALSIDSPGGSVYGTPELSELLFNIREQGKTETIAAVDPLMASAATYIGTAAETVYAVPSADVGSIGVVWSYTDYSQYLEKMGVSIEVMRIPDKKARFSGVEPLTDDMRETMRESITDSYDDFVAGMARNRGVTEKQVTKNFGGGETMSAQKAVDAGLIDGIASLDELVSGLVTKYGSRNRDRRRVEAAKRDRHLELLSSEGWNSEGWMIRRRP